MLDALAAISALLGPAMMEPTAVEGWLSTGGYFMLFGILFLCGLGLPCPEDVPLLAAGALIATGQMHWLPACATAWCGIMAGDLVLYHIGRHFGPNITRVRYIGSHINVKRLEQIERYFDKYGIWVVAIGRMFAGVRGAMVVVAGTIRYNRAKFLIADGLAAIVSGGLFVLLGHWLGDNLKDYMGRIKEGKTIFFFVALAAVLVIATTWYLRHRKATQRKVPPLDLVLPPSLPPSPPHTTPTEPTPATLSSPTQH